VENARILGQFISEIVQVYQLYRLFPG
jgi:hypothetical protein